MCQSRVFAMLFAPAAAAAVTIQHVDSGFCLELPFGNAKDTQMVWLATCTDKIEQNWHLQDGAIQYSHDKTMCLDVPDDNRQTGTSLQVLHCNGQEQQQWGYDADAQTIYLTSSSSDASLCIQMDPRMSMEQSPVVLELCTGDSSQRWAMNGASPSPPAPSPAPVPSTVVSIWNEAADRCLDLPAANAVNGQALWLWHCSGTAPNQKWSLDHDGLHYASDPRFCVDVPNGDFSEGSKLGIWTCLGYPQQQWAYDNQDGASDTGTIYIGSANVCMDQSGAKDGSEVVINQCAGSAGQVWALVKAGYTIVNRRSNKCLYLENGRTSNGASVYVWVCQNTRDQLWRFEHGAIVYADDMKKCVDVPGGDQRPGVALQLWDCLGTPQQQWEYDSKDGTIYMSQTSPSGAVMCMDVPDSARPYVKLQDCGSPSSVSTWDIAGPSGDSSSLKLI